MAQWLGVLQGCCARGDLQHIVAQLQGWFVNKTVFKHGPKPPTTAYEPAVVNRQALKEANWGERKKCLMTELEELADQGWIVTYTDGPAKWVCGWMQAGYGVWYGVQSQKNHHNHVLAHVRQSIRRGELQGVLHALKQQQQWGRLVVVFDPERVYKGVVEWGEWAKRTCGHKIYG